MLEVAFEPGARKQCGKLPLQELVWFHPGVLPPWGLVCFHPGMVPPLVCLVPPCFPSQQEIYNPLAAAAPNSLVLSNLASELSGTNEVFRKYLFARLLSGGDSVMEV